MKPVAYRFKAGESVPAGIRRIAAEQIDEVLEIAGRKAESRDRTVHEVRKCIKKLRALLRLVQGEMGERFNSENARLRDAGRELSRFRDAAAMIQTFEDVRKKYAKEIPAGSLHTIRAGLVAHKSRADRQENVKAALAGALKELYAAKKRLQQWPLHSGGFDAIGKGLEQAFRHGRDALGAANKHPDAEHYHAWRKRVKDHWYHVRLLNEVWPDVMTGYEGSLTSLEDKLGTDHNLNVLAGKIKAAPDFFGTAEQVASLLQLIERRQMELRREAEAIGVRVYGEKPRALERRLGRWWEEWRQAGKAPTGT